MANAIAARVSDILFLAQLPVALNSLDGKIETSKNSPRIALGEF